MKNSTNVGHNGKVKLNMRLINERMKRNGTKESIAVECGITPEDVENFIRNQKRLNPNEANKTLRKLESNEARQRKKALSKPELVPSPTLEISSTEKPEGEPLKNPVDELEDQEKQLSFEINDLELRHKEIVSQRRGLYDELRRIDKKLSEILGKIEEYSGKFASTVNEIQDLGEEMATISKARKEKKKAIEAVRAELEEMQKIVICVEADGTIEAPDRPDFALDDTGFQAVKDAIRDLDECQDLRVREITTLSKLIVITEHIKGEFSLICDNPELEKVFWYLKSPR